MNSESKIEEEMLSLYTNVGEIFGSKKWDIDSLKQENIPINKGVYGYFDKTDKSLKYIGSAVGSRGLRGRIWAQHLNENYLENRKEKFSKKDTEQIKKGIKKSGYAVYSTGHNL